MTKSLSELKDQVQSHLPPTPDFVHTSRNSIRFRLMAPAILTCFMVFLSTFLFGDSIRDQQTIFTQYEDSMRLNHEIIQTFESNLNEAHYEAYHILNRADKGSDVQIYTFSEKWLNDISALFEDMYRIGQDLKTDYPGQYDEALAAIEKHSIAYQHGIQEVTTLLLEQKWDQANRSMVGSNAAFAQLQQSLLTLQGQINTTNLGAVEAMIDSSRGNFFWFNLLLGATAIVVLIASATAFLSISGSLRSILAGIKNMMTQDKTAKIPEQPIQELDTLGRAFNQMAEELSTTDNTSVQEREALTQARDAALEANQNKSAFIANISHELRSPLHGISATVQLLQDSGLTKEQLQQLQPLKAATQNLSNLVNNLSDLAQLETGQKERIDVPFNLLDVLYQCLDINLGRATLKNLEVIVDYPLQLPRHLNGDPNCIRQILTHLFSNAIQYTEKGYIVIKVSEQSRIGQNTTLKWEVMDTGVGMDKQQQRRVFNRTATGERAGYTAGKPLKMGLSICRDIIANMGGNLGFVTEAGKGTTFWFTLPLKMNEQTPTHLPTTLKQVPILLIDDNQRVTEVAKQMFEQLSLTFRTLNDPKQAAALMQKAATQNTPFQIVLVDSKIGSTTGQALQKTLKGLKDVPAYHCILMATPDQSIDKKALQKEGFSGYLMKPFYPEEAMALLAQLVTRINHKEKNIFVTGNARLEEEISDGLQLPKSRRPRILLVEDEAISANVTEKLLSQLGCKVTLAADGKACLKTLKQDSFDLILMDCELPELNGYETTAQIRASKTAYAHTPIIALTANAMQDDEEKCIQAGMDDYLAKPIEKTQLIEKLRLYLQKPTQKVSTQ